MKSQIALFAVAAFAFAGCSTMIVKNPEDAPVAAAEPAADTVAATSAAPKSAQERAKELAAQASEQLRFETNSAVLKPQAISALQELAAVIASEPMQLDIAGYADSSGSDEINVPLSQKRAAAVRDVLAKGGVPAENLMAKGFSSQKPVADNSTEDGRAQNRRAEISLQ